MQQLIEFQPHLSLQSTLQDEEELEVQANFWGKPDLVSSPKFLEQCSQEQYFPVSLLWQNCPILYSRNLVTHSPSRDSKRNQDAFLPSNSTNSIMPNALLSNKPNSIFK